MSQYIDFLQCFIEMLTFSFLMSENGVRKKKKTHYTELSSIFSHFYWTKFFVLVFFSDKHSKFSNKINLNEKHLCLTKTHNSIIISRNKQHNPIAKPSPTVFPIDFPRPHRKPKPPTGEHFPNYYAPAQSTMSEFCGTKLK